MLIVSVVLCVAFVSLYAGISLEAEAGPIARALQPYVDNHVLAGAVTLVADKERVLASEVVGWADVAAREPMRPDTLFWIASTTKPLTGAALLMLVDEGRVTLDDPIEKYLPEFEGIRVAVEQPDDTILLKRPNRLPTVRDVLSHTAGFAFSSAVEDPTLDMLPLRLAARSYSMGHLVFEPGARFQYSNEGINIAGRIIEVVAGMPYEAFLKARLLDPLGMKDTTFVPTAEQARRIAKSYKANETNDGLIETPVSYLRYPLTDPARCPFPAGGLFSTAPDMLRFGQMFLNRGVFEGKRLLSEDAVAEATRRQTAPEHEGAYGLGWFLEPGNYSHAGAYHTNMWVDPGRGRVTLYFIQAESHAGNGGEGVTAFLALAAHI